MRTSLLNFSHSLEAKQLNNIHHKNHSFRGCAAPHTCSMLFLLMPVGVFSRHIEGVWHLLSTDTNAMFIKDKEVQGGCMLKTKLVLALVLALLVAFGV